MSMKRSALPRPLGLPDFPWDTLGPAKALANAHWSQICDLSVGTPVDPTPIRIQEALQTSADAPGYPLVVGTTEVRAAIHEWMGRRQMIALGDDGVVPTTGSKEMVAWLPKILGVGPGDTVLFPDVAYPTYHVGAVLAGAIPVAVDPTDLSTWPEDATLVWLNTPANPSGEVMSADQLRAVVIWARARGAVVVSDECYAELDWTQKRVQSVLGEGVCGGDPTGLLVVYSLSKQSNMAGYRAGILVGDPTLVQAVVEARKHGGMMVPSPVQAAIAAALSDTEHVADQRSRYGQRRDILIDAVTQAGLTVSDRTEAGLYLWISAPEDSQGMELPPAQNRGRSLVMWFARRGILVAPGDFYGEKSREYVRMALTGTDEVVREAAKRLVR